MEQNVLGRNVCESKCLGVSCPRGGVAHGAELPMGRVVHGAKYLWGELSMDHVCHGASCQGAKRFGEFRWSGLCMGRVVQESESLWCVHMCTIEYSLFKEA
jgi:hypothetical protein